MATINQDPFPNDWESVASTPSDQFTEPPVEDILIRTSSWDLPFPYEFIIRVQDPNTFRIKEKAYKDRQAAKRYIQQESSRGNIVTYYDADRLGQYELPTSGS